MYVYGINAILQKDGEWWTGTFQKRRINEPLLIPIVKKGEVLIVTSPNTHIPECTGAPEVDGHFLLKVHISNVGKASSVLSQTDRNIF